MATTRLERLTGKDGEPVWINPDNVVSVRPAPGRNGLALITMTGEPPVKIVVRESLEYVLYSIKGTF